MSVGEVITHVGAGVRRGLSVTRSSKDGGLYGARDDDLLERSSCLAAAGSEEGVRIVLKEEDSEEDLEEEDLEDAARMLILCGTPGSGKSTLASALLSRGWTVVCQDALGSRKAVERAARGALLLPNARLVVDRCNQDAAQRAHWTCGAPARMRMHTQSRLLQRPLESSDTTPPLFSAYFYSLARERRDVEILLCRVRVRRLLAEHTSRRALCVWLDVGVDECVRRVLGRATHRTLPPTKKSARIVRRFVRDFVPPTVQERLRVLHVRAHFEPHELGGQVERLADALTSST